jgi:hypothetical protein
LETCSVPVIHPGDDRNRAGLWSIGTADCLRVFWRIDANADYSIEFVYFLPTDPRCSHCLLSAVSWIWDFGSKNVCTDLEIHVLSYLWLNFFLYYQVPHKISYRKNLKHFHLYRVVMDNLQASCTMLDLSVWLPWVLELL